MVMPFTGRELQAPLSPRWMKLWLLTGHMGCVKVRAPRCIVVTLRLGRILMKGEVTDLWEGGLNVGLVLCFSLRQQSAEMMEIYSVLYS